MGNDNVSKAISIITQTHYLTLATSDSLGNPWVAALYYAYDASAKFYFISAKDSLHVKHIMQNTAVAFAIYDSTLPPESADGVQVCGVAREVEEADLPSVMKTYYLRRFPDEEERKKHNHSAVDFQMSSPRRFIQIEPSHVYTLDSAPGKGDQRVEVDLNEIRMVLGNVKAKPQAS